MFQFYRDAWRRRSHLTAPLTDLVAECGETKATKKNKTKKRPWYWDETHTEAFEQIKATLARDCLLTYPDYSGTPFEIYTDASSRQLGAIITQKGKVLAYFSRKLNTAQQKYSVTELELLSIVETLKEFKGMLWGQNIKVYTDHKNLTRDGLGTASDRVYRWRLILEEYGPELIYIKGSQNVVADAMSRLKYDPDSVKNLSMHHRCRVMAHLLVHTSDTSVQLGGEQSTYAHKKTSKVADANDIVNYVFANRTEEEDIYPPTIAEIAVEQRKSRLYKHYFKAVRGKKKKWDKNLSVKMIEDTQILVYKDSRLVIPNAELQHRIVTWYHHYLQHPGEKRLENTLTPVMYWRGMTAQIRKYVKSCDRCQKGKRRRQKYGHLPSKIAETRPWKSVSCDLIGPYTIKGKDGTILDFMCLTMIDPATGWFEIVELPNTDVTYVRNGKDIKEVIIDKSAATVSNLFNKTWLCRYPRPTYLIYDNGGEFKSHFKTLCDSYSLKRKPTTIKNPQANAILERIHGVIGDMMRTSSLDNDTTITPNMVDEFLSNAAWAIRSTYHTVLRSSPGAAVFGRDMLFDIPYLADWTEIGRRRQQLVDQNNTRENNKRVDFDYAVGQKVLLIKDGILRKAEDKNDGPYVITQVYTNGTVRIQRGTINERLNIRRLTPYFEADSQN